MNVIEQLQQHQQHVEGAGSDHIPIVNPVPAPPTTPRPVSERREGDETKSEAGKNGKEEEKDELEIMAGKLADIVEKSLTRIDPFLKMINYHVDILDRKRANEEEINESEFVKTLRPLIEQASAILQETYGAIKALDPKGNAVNEAQLKAEDNKASPEQGRLAKGLAKLTGDVTKTIENAKDKIKDMPKAKGDLGPMLDLLSQPLIQILGAVGLLVHGVLTLVGNLLGGIGLGGIIQGLLQSLGLKDLLSNMGLGNLIGGGKKKEAAKK